MNENEVLSIVVTSGMGKKGVMLANTIGVIDSDYYGNESTDGNLGFNLYNYGNKPYVINQFIFKTAAKAVTDFSGCMILLSVRVIPSSCISSRSKNIS